MYNIVKILNRYYLVKNNNLTKMILKLKEKNIKENQIKIWNLLFKDKNLSFIKKSKYLNLDLFWITNITLFTINNILKDSVVILFLKLKFKYIEYLKQYKNTKNLKKILWCYFTDDIFSWIRNIWNEQFVFINKNINKIKFENKKIVINNKYFIAKILDFVDFNKYKLIQEDINNNLINNENTINNILKDTNKIIKLKYWIRDFYDNILKIKEKNKLDNLKWEDLQKILYYIRKKYYYYFIWNTDEENILIESRKNNYIKNWFITYYIYYVIKDKKKERYKIFDKKLKENNINLLKRIQIKNTIKEMYNLEDNLIKKIYFGIIEDYKNKEINKKEMKKEIKQLWKMIISKDNIEKLYILCKKEVKDFYKLVK